jgi:hypothetical protein
MDMSERKKRMLWFTGIYVSSLMIFALVTYLLRVALRLL